MRRALTAHLIAASLIFAANFETGDLTQWEPAAPDGSEWCMNAWPEPTGWCPESATPSDCRLDGCGCYLSCGMDEGSQCRSWVQVCATPLG